MQLSIYLRGAMMSFVSGYYGDDSSSVRAHGAFERLHFTRHGISQIHERRTVSRAVVKLPWNFDRNYPSPLCTRFRRYFPVVLFRSMRIHGSSRWNYRLLHGILDFSPWASGCILNPYSVGILASLSQTAILLRLYFLGRAITYGDVDTTFRGDWIVIDCRIILERWNRYSEIGEDACIHLLWKFNLKRACILRWFTSRWVCVSIRVNMCHARVNASGVWHVRRIGILNENSFWWNCTWQTTFGSNRIWSTWNK